MRSILVQGGRDAGMAARLETAMDIARTHEGHLSIAIDTPIERFVSVDPYGGTSVAKEALDEALAADDALAAAFAGKLSHEDVPFDVMQYEIEPLQAMLSAALLADLAVVSHDCGYAGDFAVEAGCPVLILPGQQRLAFPLRSACIAWNGSAEAAAALRGAIGLLWGCQNVHVVTVRAEREPGFPPTDALRYLSRHDIGAELHEVDKQGSVEETLEAKFRQLGAELLVMGAYGHGRLREFMFGGVSRYFLTMRNAPPMLIAH